MEHTAKLNAGLTQLIHWKPIQLKFCIKVVYLSPNESTMLECKKVIYYSTPRPPPTPRHKKKWGELKPPMIQVECLIHDLTIGL